MWAIDIYSSGQIDALQVNTSSTVTFASISSAQSQAAWGTALVFLGEDENQNHDFAKLDDC